jgi:hypothetical protein
MIGGVGGNTKANDTWPITTIGLHTFTLNGSSSGPDPYSGGGAIGDGGFTIPSNSAAGIWQRTDLSHEVNAKWFGAKFDGTADDTVAIQACIDAAKQGINLAGRVIILPVGTARVTTTLRIASFIGLTIRGQGKSATEITYDGASTTLESLTVTVAASAGTFTKSAGADFTTNFAIGDYVSWTGFTNGGNNVVSRKITDLSANVMTFADLTGLANETGNGDEAITTAPPLFIFDGCQDCLLESFLITTQPGRTLAEVVRIWWDIGTSVSLRNSVKRVKVLGNNRITDGIHIKVGAQGDTGNESHVFEDVQINDYTGTAAIISGFNAKLIRFVRCIFSAGTIGPASRGIDTALVPGSGGSFSCIDCKFRRHTAGDIRLGKPNDPISFYNCYSEQSRMLLETVNDEGGAQVSRVWPIQFIGHRWVTNLSALPADRVIVRILTPGPISFRGCRIGGMEGVHPLKCEYRPQLIAGRATGTLTTTGNASEGETIATGGVTYTWRGTLTGGVGLPYDVLIGSSASVSLENLEIAFRAQEDEEGVLYGAGTLPHPTVSGIHTGTTFKLQARTAGTAGNSIGTTELMSNASFSGAALSGGVDDAFQNCRGNFSLEDSVWATSADTDSIFTEMLPESLKGSLHYDSGVIRPLAPAVVPYDYRFFVPERDEDYEQVGLPIPRIWYNMDRYDGEGQGEVFDLQRRKKTLDLVRYAKQTADYGLMLGRWTGKSIAFDGIAGEGLVTDENTIINNLTDSVVFAMRGILLTPASQGIVFTLGSAATGAGQGPRVVQLPGGNLRVSADNQNVDGVVNYDDGEPHTVVLILDYGNATLGLPKRLMVVTEQEIIDYVATVESFPVLTANTEGKGLGTKVGGEHGFTGSVRWFAAWIGGAVREIRAEGTPGAWKSTDVIAQLHSGAPSAATPVFQAAGTLASGTGGVVPAWPAHHRIDDVGFLFVETDDAGAVSTPSGWTLLDSVSATGTKHTVFWRRAASASESSPTITDAGDHASAVIITFRGCRNVGKPYLAYAREGEASSTSHTIAGLRTTLGNTLLVLATTWSTDNAGPFVKFSANSDLAGMTERFDGGHTNGNGGGIAVATAQRASIGVVGDTSITFSSAGSAAMMSIALGG